MRPPLHLLLEIRGDFVELTGTLAPAVAEGDIGIALDLQADGRDRHQLPTLLAEVVESLFHLRGGGEFENFVLEGGHGSIRDWSENKDNTFSPSQHGRGNDFMKYEILFVLTI